MRDRFNGLGYSRFDQQEYMKLDIAQNTEDIATNTTNISTNTSNIATNTANISTNTSSVAQNTSDIAQNTSDIAQNTLDITTNASDIAQLGDNISLLTDNSEVNKRIDSLYLIGADSATNYYVGQCTYRESDDFKIYRIYEEGGTEVCRYLSSTDAIDGKYFILAEYDSSGIYGYIFPDLSEYYTNDSITANLDYTLATTKNDVHTAHLEQWMIEKEEARRNHHNPANLTLLTNLGTQSYSGVTQLKVENDASAVFDLVTELFPIEDGESITISNANLFQCTGYLVDSNRMVHDTISFTNSSLNGSETVTNELGFDAYFALKIRNRSGENNGQYAQIEYGDTKTNYEFYRDSLLKEDEIGIVLPKTNYLLEGLTYNIFKKNIINANPLKYFDVVADDADDGTMLNYTRQFWGEPTDTGDGYMNIRLIDNKRVLARAYLAFNRLAKQTTGELTIFQMGDSFSDIADGQTALSNRCIEDGITFNTIGLKNEDAGSHSESQTGGTLANSFLEDRGDAFVLAVTGLTDDGMSDGYASTVFEDSNGYQYRINGRKVDGSGDGVLRLNPLDHTATPPENDTITYVSGNSNYTTVDYTTVDTVNLNPLWNPTTEEVDFSYYFQYYGYETEFDLTNSANKFALILQFSWNDNAEYYDEENVTEVVENFKTTIDQFHSEYPDAYVIIGIEPAASPKASSITSRIMGVQWGRMEFAKAIFTQFEDDDNYNTFCFIAPTYAYMDTENAFNSTTEVLSEWFPDVEDEYITDPVHPNTAGFSQMADCYYPIVHKILSL